MAQKTQAYLKSIIKKLTWKPLGKSLPMSQGLALKFLIKHYKIRGIKKLGYSGGHSAIGIETGKQYLFWKDTGVGVEFLGIVNKKGVKKR